MTIRILRQTGDTSLLYRIERQEGGAPIPLPSYTHTPFLWRLDIQVCRHARYCTTQESTPKKTMTHSHSRRNKLAMYKTCCISIEGYLATVSSGNRYNYDP